MSPFKKLTVFICFVICAVVVLADEHMENSDKLNEGLLYHATFDNTLKAERAAGEAILTAFGPEDQRFAPGIMNQGLRIGVNDAKEKFYAIVPVSRNIDHKQGSISFWFKPENWDGNCKDFNLFVSGVQKNNYFYIYKYGAPSFGFCTINAGKSTFKQTSSQDWKRGEWHHIAVVWASDYQRVFFDGKPIVTDSRQLANEPMTALYLGARGWEAEKGTSILDELKIYNRPLSLQEIQAEFSRFGKRSDSSGKSSFTVGQGHVTVDGVLADGEYGFANTGFVLIPDGYANEQTSYALSHDDTYIYVAVQAMLPRPPICNITVRDGDVFTDDSMEIWLSNASGKLYQFIFNTKGVLYDALPLEKIGPNWNIKDYRAACTVKDKLWTLEVALNKAELGGGDDWLLNLGRTTFVGDKPVPTSMMAVRKHLGYSDREHYAELKLRKTAPVFRLKSLGNINNGDLDLLIETPCQVTVGNRTEALSNYKEVFTPKDGKIATRQKLAPGGRLEIVADGVFQHSYQTKKLSPVSIQYIFVDKDSTLQVAVKNESGEDGGKLTLNMKSRATGKVYSKTAVVQGANFFWNERFDMSAMPTGDYDFEGFYTDPTATAHAPFVQVVRKPGPVNAWDNNTIGIYPNEVPPPWKPIAVDGQSVKTLFHTLSWNASLFPASMVAMGHDILVGPVQLLINGKELEGISGKCVKRAPDKVEYVASGTLDGIRAVCHFTIEFDGMTWVKMTLDGRNQTIDSLIFQLPLKPQFAVQVHSCEIDKHVGKPAIAYTGVLRNGYWQKNLYNRPAFWVGNDHAGVAFFAENLINWVNSDRNKSAEIIGGKEKSLVRMTIIDKPVPLDGSRSYEFGLQMTPVKNYNPTPRTNRLGVDWGWGSPVKYFNYYDSGEEFFNKESHDQRRLPILKRNGRYFLYIASNGASPYAPEWAWFARNWTSNKIGDYYIELQIKDLAARNHDVWTYACLNSKSFREFLLWQLNNVINDPAWDIQNIYYDLVGPRLCANTEHGCGWRDDSGNMRPTLNIRGVRDFQKRIYSLMKKRHPEGLHYYHVTGQPALPVVNSFCDAVVEGESFYNNYLPEKETYFGAVDPDGFRVAYSGEKWGYQLIFIPQLERSAMFLRPERRKLWNMPNPPEAMDRANRHLAGYFYAHDILAWGGGFSFYTLYNKCWQKQQAFFSPWDSNVQFIGYWADNKPFTVKSMDSKRVLVSAYLKGSKAMVAISNDTDKPQTVEVAYPGKKVLESFTGTPVKTEKDRFTITLPPQVFDLIYLVDDFK